MKIDPTTSATHRTAAIVHAMKYAGVVHRRGGKPLKSKPPNLIEQEYRAAIIGQLGLRTAFEPLLAALPALLEQAARERGDGSSTRDDATASRRLGDVFAHVQQRIGENTQLTRLEGIAAQFAQRTSAAQRLELGRQAKQAIGIDITTVDRRMPALIEQFATRNANQIAAIGRRAADDVSRLVGKAFEGGVRASDLADDIQKRLGVSENAATFMARDQIGTLTAQVSAERNQELGIREFVWTTMGDERVRPEHVILDGQTFSYDDPPSEGLPGEADACRCTATPSFEHILGVLNGEPDPDAPTNQIEAPSAPQQVEPASRPEEPSEPRVNQIEAPVAPQRAEPSFEAVVSEEQARKFLDDIAQKPITATEHSAVYSYQGGKYIDINEYARTGKLDPGSTFGTAKEAKETIKSIDSAIAKGKTPDDVLVYRGFRPEGATPREGITGKVEVGSTITDKGFVSTSLSKETASEFGNVLLEIQVPEGTPAAFVPATGGMKESELLLARGSKFEVLSVREENGKTIASVRVVPKDAPKTRAKRSHDAAMPDGFAIELDANMFDVIEPPIRGDVPRWATAGGRDAVHVVRPSDLVRVKLYGIDTGGDAVDDERTKRILDLWSTGGTIRPLEVDITVDDDYFISDGNHRFWASIFADDRPMAVKFRAIRFLVGKVDTIQARAIELLQRYGHDRV